MPPADPSLLTFLTGRGTSAAGSRRYAAEPPAQHEYANQHARGISGLTSTRLLDLPEHSLGGTLPRFASGAIRGLAAVPLRDPAPAWSAGSLAASSG